MIRAIPLLAVVVCALAANRPALAESDLVVPWAIEHYSADEDCRKTAPPVVPVPVEHNHAYFAPPAGAADWPAWLESLRAYRREVREKLHDTGRSMIVLEFQGTRAWVRLREDWALAADARPGEKVVVEGRALAVEGNSTLCLAFDYHQRKASSNGPWYGWSGVLGTVAVEPGGQWHDFRVEATIPEFDRDKGWVRPILGMDGTHERTPGTILLGDLTVRFPRTDDRAERWKAVESATARRIAFDDALYRRDDLRWTARNFVCGFVFIYDRAFWDPDTRRYRVEELLDDARDEFGGYDSIVLWQAYPRVGADGRNQFDFYRHMPGGLDAVRDVVGRFHRRGVKVFVSYNPWDTGTRREGVADEVALSELIARIEADGVFLDTMARPPVTLRQEVDRRRPGVAFEPEGSTSLEHMELQNGSWAQWFKPFPGIGVLRLKWIEPRHVQHQIHRWDRSHREELTAAWLNGSGMLVWENVFGSWNPWNAEDRATLRRMAPVLRHFADLLADERWLPCYPTLDRKVYASCWENDRTRLWTLVRDEPTAGGGAVLEIDDRGGRFFDVYGGGTIEPERAGQKLRLAMPPGRYGAIVAVREESDPALAKLLEHQAAETQRPVPTPADDPHVQARPVIEPIAPPAVAAPASSPKPDARCPMLTIEGGPQEFTVRHTRRECGCYPDPGTPPAEWLRFLTGENFDEKIEHHVRVELAAYEIDARPVTNAQYEAFVKASGYRPASGEHFLEHWGGPECPAGLRDEPVVYVDLDDARAYAAWVGLRLPTEWQWHAAARKHGEHFEHDAVHEWTESVRDDGHTRFVMLRGGCRYDAKTSSWYFPGGPQPIDSHAKFSLMHPGLDRCGTIGFRCVK